MLRWTSESATDRTHLNQPVIVAAFEGWNDAGDAATETIRHLESAWNAVDLADIDPEEFYDFTTIRPEVRMNANGNRVVHWPSNQFRWAAPTDAPNVILLRGIEPQLKWRTFCEQIIEVARVTNARLVVTVGALLADVAHTRPTSVFGTAYAPKVIEALHLEPSRYEGPTGIVGVLHDMCSASGVNSASLWAAVPSYVPAAPSPKAVLALIDRICAVLGTTVPLGDLTERIGEYETQISNLVNEDEDTAAYVAHLEQTYDSEELAGTTVEGLVSEVERFLSEQ